MRRLCHLTLLGPILTVSCAQQGHSVHVENASGAAVPMVVCRLQRVDGESNVSFRLEEGKSGWFGAPVGSNVRSVDIVVTWDTAASSATWRVAVSRQHPLDVKLRLLPGHKVEFVDGAAAAAAGLSLAPAGG